MCVYVYKNEIAISYTTKTVSNSLVLREERDNWVRWYDDDRNNIFESAPPRLCSEYRLLYVHTPVHIAIRDHLKIALSMLFKRN